MHATKPSLDQRIKNILSIITLLLLAAAPSVMGQGAIFFNNRVLSVGLFAPIYGVNPNCLGLRLSGNANTNGGTTDYTGWPLLSGTGFTAELWAETSPNSGVFQPLTGAGAKVPFRTTVTTGGVIQSLGIPVLVPSVPGPADGSARFQVRAWNNGSLGLSGTYAQALSISNSHYAGLGWATVGWGGMKREDQTGVWEVLQRVCASAGHGSAHTPGGVCCCVRPGLSFWRWRADRSPGRAS